MEFKREKASQARYLSIVTTVSYLAIQFPNDTLLVGAISSMSGLIFDRGPCKQELLSWVVALIYLSTFSFLHQ